MQQFGVLNRKKKDTIRSGLGSFVKCSCLKPFAEVYTFPSSNSTDQEIHSVFRD